MSLPTDICDEIVRIMSIAEGFIYKSAFEKKLYTMTRLKLEIPVDVYLLYLDFISRFIDYICEITKKTKKIKINTKKTKRNWLSYILK
jgi:hypothetical protein